MGCDLSPLQVLAEFPELPALARGAFPRGVSSDGRRTAVATPPVRPRPKGGDGKRRNVPTAKLSYKLNLATKKNKKKGNSANRLT